MPTDEELQEVVDTVGNTLQVSAVTIAAAYPIIERQVRKRIAQKLREPPYSSGAPRFIADAIEKGPK